MNELSVRMVVSELNAVDGHLSSVSDDSKATIPVVPAMHAVARTGVCPNFSHGDPCIIIEKSEENSGEKYPVMSSTVAGEPVCWERSDQDATVTTSVADSEQEIRTGQWEKDSQENSSVSVTSRGRINDCCATTSCTISEDSGMLPLGPAVVVEAFNRCDTMGEGVGCSDKGSSECLAAELSVRPLPIGGECSDGASATNSAVTMRDDGRVDMECVKRDDKCKNFGLSSGPPTVVSGCEAHLSSYQYPDPSQVVSFVPSSASEVQGLQMELEKMGLESEETKNDTGLHHSPTDDEIRDGARLDQLALAATIAPQWRFRCERQVSRIRRHPVWQ